MLTQKRGEEKAWYGHTFHDLCEDREVLFATALCAKLEVVAPQSSLRRSYPNWATFHTHWHVSLLAVMHT